MEARAVPGVLPGLLAELDCGADLLEVAGDPEHGDHGQEEADQGLEEEEEEHV